MHVHACIGVVVGVGVGVWEGMGHGAFLWVGGYVVCIYLLTSEPQM